MKDVLKKYLSKIMNHLLDPFFSDVRPIVLVGEVGQTHAKIFVAHKGKLNDELKVHGKYDIHRKKLIVDDKAEYSAFCITIRKLEQDRKYTIPVQVNKSIVEVEFKTQSSTKKSITFLLGSCNLHTLKWINNPEKTFETLNKLRVSNNIDFMLHVGDQIYADIPSPFFEPTLNYYCKKYFSAWSSCKSANYFLSKLSNYMTLDDHEIINNYRNRSDREKYKSGLDAYNIFQLSHSPKLNNQLHYQFDYNGFPFFVLDVRTSRNEGDNNMICSSQEKALYEWLLNNKDHKTFKFIVTAIPFLVDMKNTEHDKWVSGRFRSQRNRILEFIVKNNITNIVFLSGDIHCSLVTEANITTKGYDNPVTIHEITSSPLNQLQIESINNFIRNHSIENDDIIGRVSTYKYYDQSSNVALVSVEPDKIAFQYFKTATGERVESGTISLKV